ncbi:potassium/proton antiporter [Botrimarina mediterranea]|uniref:K(+)/H(+) antiporter NhaP2 n=1 Tax=Botrimarina mediterranea TaxID=2528022 RepID=A0A518K315_9BACT|nr:potassium/proton antiporter [Botrimarina mediterranea]QDV72192.1 K(+)/H(+) antiporter NhaP2 [Botrimarina mediterranea]QDV76735.1 K(+)/H(+) antiporter NhaP2 [Planctomycetes bacterium K2D]
MFLIDTLILGVGVMLLLGIVSSKLSSRLGVPVLVLFLLLGILAGSEGIGGIEFENYRLAHAIGTVSLAVILFDGGLSTSMTSIRLAWKPAVTLATVGVLITSVIVGFAAVWILGVSPLQGLLLGSIVGSTDAAAVFSVLRSGGVHLSRRLAAVLEVESASNDPMAIFLTIGCIELLLGNQPLGVGLLGMFVAQMAIGGACGLVGGYMAAWIVDRIELAAAGMYPVLVTSTCFLTFGAAASLGGSGFLAVYLAGLVIGNRPLVFKRGVLAYHDSLAWLSQIMMFVVLGLLCFPSRLMEVSGRAMLLAAVLILVARPIAVIASTFPFKFSWRETAFMSWVGLKGAVPITLATFPLMLATPDHALQARVVFDVVFFIVVVSAIVQGVGLSPAARWLGLEHPPAPVAPVTLEISSLKHVEGDIVDYAVDANSRATGRKVKNLGLPEGAVIAMIARGNQIIPPQGATRIEAGDHVILVLRPNTRTLVNRVFAPKGERDHVLPSLEFPLRAGTKLRELVEVYELSFDGPPDCTLVDAMQHHLGHPPKLGETVCYGATTLRVDRLSPEGAVEIIAMSVITEPPQPAPARPSAPSDKPPSNDAESTA